MNDGYELFSFDLTEAEAIGDYANSIGMSDEIKVEALGGRVYKIKDPLGLLVHERTVKVSIGEGSQGEKVWRIEEVSQVITSTEKTTKMPKRERNKVATSLAIWGDYRWFERVAVRPAGGTSDKLIVSLLATNSEATRIFPVASIIRRVKSELDLSARSCGDHTYNVHLAKLKSSSDALELILRAEVVANE